jgi:hypothetical protein
MGYYCQVGDDLREANVYCVLANRIAGLADTWSLYGQMKIFSQTHLIKACISRGNGSSTKVRMKMA